MSVLSDAGREYLRDHGIDELILAEHGVTERDGRLHYPNGRSLALNGHGPKVLQPKGQPLEVWWPGGEPHDGATVLVCEGESDALAVLSTIRLSHFHGDPLAGITVAAVPGTPYPASRLADDLRGVGVAIVAYDGDEAGREATMRVAAELHKAGIACHDLAVPDGHDVADCLGQLDPNLRVPWLTGQLSDARPIEGGAPPRHTLGNGAVARPLESGSTASIEGAPPVWRAPGAPPARQDRYDGRIIDVTAALAEPDEPLPWRCHGFAADGYLTVVAGRGGEGKSWLTLSLACGVARGASVAGIDCVRGRALLFDAENGRRLIARRLRAAGVSPDVAVQPVDAGGLHVIRDIDWFRDVIEREAANLVVFDSLRVLSSGVKENDSDAMEPIITALKLLARDTGAAIVLVHHRGRSEFSDFRGSSVILDQTDLLFTLGRITGDPDGRHRRKVTTVKCRIDEEPAPWWVSINADRARGLVTIDAAEPFEGEGRARDQLRDDVLEALSGIARSARGIAKAVGREPNDGTVRRVLHDLEAEGLAEKRDDGWARAIGGWRDAPARDRAVPRRADRRSSRRGVVRAERTPSLRTLPKAARRVRRPALVREPALHGGEAMTEFTAGRENGRRRPRGYADWRPQAKTRVLLEQVQQVFTTYEDYLPLTVRQVFYALVGTFEYPKTDNAYERLCEHLVRARRARMIPFDWLRDDGVVVMQQRWFDGVADFWDHVGQQAREFEHDKQIGQPVYVELWTEAAGMMPQLARVAEKFSVPVYSCGGFASLPAVRHIVDRARRRNVPTVLLHVGDFDPSGEAVFDHIVGDASEFLQADRIIGTQKIIAERVALQAWQVAEFGLPTSPAKSTDSRSAGWTGGTCQVEALPPDVLAMLVEEAIQDYLDGDLLAQHGDTEREERVQLLRALPSGEATS